MGPAHDRRSASLYRPREAAAPLPAWIVLHGITHPGREHPELIRFARALAASGAVVVVPDVPDWRGLRVAPGCTVPTISDSLDLLAERNDVAIERVAVVGFSFGATLALVASVQPKLAGRVAGIAAWGGYADLGREIRFLLTGDHELDGRHFMLEPDPYGRWIMGANYLTSIPDHADAQDVAEALRDLADAAARERRYAGDAAYDAAKARLREHVAPARRLLYDLFARPSGTPVPDGAEELADQLASAVSRREPILADTEVLRGVRVPVAIAHGRGDRLVPFTEGARLRRLLPAHAVRHQAVTGLFAHSGAGAVTGLAARVIEPIRYLRLLRAVLALP